MSNPLLEKLKIPGETVRLPSLGIFYKNGELSADSQNGEVHIYPMSAYDELIMHSPDKLINGHAIAEVFSRCIPSVIKPLDLFSKDVDFLMMCLRRVTYGPEINIDYQHFCADAKTHTYPIDISKFITNAKNINPTLINSLYTVALENNQIVKIHPIRLKDVISLMQETQKISKKHSTNAEQLDADTLSAGESNLLDSISRVIESVDDVTDQQLILEWLRNLPVKMHRQLSKAIDSSSDWGTNTETVEKCKDCGESITLEVPLNPLTFFI